MSFWNKLKEPKSYPLDELIKVQGGVALSASKKDEYTIDPPIGDKRGRVWEPKSLVRSMRGASNAGNTLLYNGTNRGDLFRYLRDSVPIISSAIGCWVNLCTTKLSRTIEGTPAEREKSNRLLGLLDARLLELPYGRGSGLHKLLQGLYMELFTTGRFACEAIMEKDESSINHLAWIDPYTISWIHGENGWEPYRRDSDEKLHRIEPANFFYGTLITDLTNPMGVEPLSSIPFVAEVDQQMLEDMARSSHNSGTPRFQVKIERPEPFAHENARDYIDRANRYFRDVNAEFQNLEPDQNIFTWRDVDIQVIGGSGNNWNWRLNREQVIEDVITGMKLYPWVLGRTHRSTQNWVKSQFDLLMHMTSVYQRSGLELADWITNLELRKHGVEAYVSHSFARHPDPFALEKFQAEREQFEIIDAKVRRGYISKDDGARELGYVKAFATDDSSTNKRPELALSKIEEKEEN